MAKISIVSALGAIFAIAAALSVFLPWISLETLINTTRTFSGWEIFTEELYENNFEYYMLPVFVIALGAVSALTFLLVPKGGASVLLTVVFGLAIVALSFLTYYQLDQRIAESWFSVLFKSVNMGYGLFLALGSGAMTVICGAAARDD